jgi:hypothetical protein
MQQDALVLALLKDYIIVSRLNNGLSATGLNTEDFNIGLAGTIFQLMELGHDDLSDEQLSEFLSVTDKIIQFDVSEWQQEVESLAYEAFALLLNSKQRIKSQFQGHLDI